MGVTLNIIYDKYQLSPDLLVTVSKTMLPFLTSIFVRSRQITMRGTAIQDSFFVICFYLVSLPLFFSSFWDASDSSVISPPADILRHSCRRRVAIFPVVLRHCKVVIRAKHSDCEEGRKETGGVFSDPS